MGEEAIVTQLAGVKAISFDVDGTLWDFETIMRRSLSEVLKELARHDSRAADMLDVERMVEIRERVHSELRYKVTDLNEVRRLSIVQALNDAGRPDDELADRLFGVYVMRRDAGRALFDDVRPSLASLKERHVLGLLSNGNSYAARLGIANLISFEVFSQDHGGIEKPDARIFEIALDSAGCSADELVHVGDSVGNDVAGAKSAGVRSVWLNRNGDSTAPDIEPDAEIASLRELLEILQ